MQIFKLQMPEDLSFQHSLNETKEQHKAEMLSKEATAVMDPNGKVSLTKTESRTFMAESRLARMKEDHGKFLDKSCLGY